MEIKKENINGNIVETVNKNTIAEEIGIEKGDRIISINGKKLDDIIDYRFLIASEFIEMEVEKKTGEIWDLEIEKEYDEDIGIEFVNPLIDKARFCTNNCIFCFIDQLPKGMRKTLYFKDDDSRLSFLMGNFVTLTNMSEEDIERIIKYRISPINVSVHTTNSELRIKILKNKNAGRILEILERFKKADLEINCQIVAMPGINDGKELVRTLEDLTELYPTVRTIGIVPIGLTKYRKGLENLRTFTKEESDGLINIVEKVQTESLKKVNSRIAFISDEFYIMSGKRMPKEEEYEGYSQIENGIGLTTYFMDNVIKGLENIEINLHNKKSYLIPTGVLAYENIVKITKVIKKKFPNINFNVVKVENSFFGKNITVTGLLTAQDIINRIKKEPKSDEIILSKAMFKSDENIFLDNMTLEEFEKEMNTTVRISDIEKDNFIKIFTV